MEWGTWLSEVYAGKNYEMTIIGFDGKVTPFRTVERYGSKIHRNLVNFKSEEFDKVISKIVNAKDEETRTELYKESQRLLTEGAAAVFIQAPNYIAAVNKNLEGFEIYPVYVLDVSLLNYKIVENYVSYKKNYIFSPYSFSCFSNKLYSLNVIPGDPVLSKLGVDATQEQVVALRKELGLDKSGYAAYGNWLEKKSSWRYG